jgi:hypothetical protein
MSLISTNDNDEKMALNINIQIENSEALIALAYNSDTEKLFVTYKSGGTYNFDSVSVGHMLGLIGLAITKNSWGSAFHTWKKAWHERMTPVYTQNLFNETKEFVDNLHPLDRARLEDILPMVLAASD